MTPRCLGCDTPLDDPSAAIYGWCAWCAGAVLHDVLALRDGSPDVVGARVAWCRDQGCEALASVIVGTVPFAWEGIADHE